MTSAAGPKVLRVGILTPVRTLDPVESVDSVSHLAVAQIYDTPYALPLHVGEAVRPQLFDGPLVREDDAGRVLSGGIVEGASYSDGTPVTAEQVAAGLGKVETIRRLARVEARDDRVVFVLEAPNPRFELSLTMSHASAVLHGAGRLLGSGPFLPAPGTTLEHLRLVRNPHFRRPVPIEEVVFQVYPPDPDGRAGALMKALEAGEVDFTLMLSRNDAASLQGVRKAFRPSNATAILHLNATRPALASTLVRQAITLAVDRTAVAEVSYSNALAFTATSLIPPGMGPTPDKHVFDLERAKALLGQAAPELPLRLEMLTIWAPRPYLPNPQPVAELIARQLAAIGVEAKVAVPRDSNEFFRRRDAGDYDLALAGWIADTPDPADFLEANLQSDRVPRTGHASAGCCNLSRRPNPDLDAALKVFREKPSPESLDLVLTLVAEEAPLLPLMYGPTVAVSSFRAQNVEVPPLGLPDLSTFDLG